ncbi:hypothetical protein AMECASPLE_002297 [Ameca splendens]|uniref:Uncharacterized protein n=1 Tax=Ameca splendens TaxID=208324 RepID=A0ABV0XY92_9TELE
MNFVSEEEGNHSVDLKLNKRESHQNPAILQPGLYKSTCNSFCKVKQKKHFEMQAEGETACHCLLSLNDGMQNLDVLIKYSSLLLLKSTFYKRIYFCCSYFSSHTCLGMAVFSHLH